MGRKSTKATPYSKYYKNIPEEKKISKDKTPKVIDNNDILILLKKKYDLKIIRNQKALEIKERRKELYNISLESNRLEEEIDNILISRINI